MVKIRKNLVPAALIPKITYGKGNKKKRICIHETDNLRTGADADAHSRLQKNGNSRQASWHWQVDDVEAVQSFEHDIRCWAAGSGNHEDIHIEICVNEDGDYKKALQNAAALVAYIRKQEPTVKEVVQHNHHTGKNCPRILRSGKVLPWSSFLQMAKGAQEIAKPAAETKDEILYRLYTGTFRSKQAAENALDVFKHRFGWTCYLEAINGSWRVKTGTFVGKEAANKGAEKIKKAEIASVVHVLKA